MSEADGECWILWQFDVKAGEEARFEREYGPEGGWVQLFTGAAGYLGTELSPHAHIARRYLTIDRWTARDDYDRFRKQHQAEYQTLDAQCENLTENEGELGCYEIASTRRS